MNVTCPSCGADMDLDVLLAHEDSRQALAKLALISLPLGKRTLQYIRLFKPATRQLGHGRVVSLIEQLLPDMQRGAISHNGRDWQADIESWSMAFDVMLQRRDTGKLTLPLKTHGYLYEVLAGQADKHEARVERGVEQAKRAHRVAGPVEQLTQVANVVISKAPAGPSAYALRIKAEQAAKLAARSKPDSTTEEAA